MAFFEDHKLNTTYINKIFIFVFYKVGINYLYDNQRFHNRFILSEKVNDYFTVLGPNNEFIFHEQLSYERKLY